MTKLDLKKKYKEFYSGKPEEVVNVIVPKFQYLMIDGSGYPGISQEYQEAMETLFPLSYSIKFLMKKKGQDYTVMPLEGLWWADDMDIFTLMDDSRKDEWKWTSLIHQPEFVTQKDVDQAIKDLREKNKPLPSIKKLHFESLKESTSAQILHIGPFSEEGPNIQKLHSFIQEQGGEFDGHIQKHHEIYLSDMRRTTPEKLKTIIRQPYTLSD